MESSRTRLRKQIPPPRLTQPSVTTKVHDIQQRNADMDYSTGNSYPKNSYTSRCNNEFVGDKLFSMSKRNLNVNMKQKSREILIV